MGSLRTPGFLLFVGAWMFLCPMRRGEAQSLGAQAAPAPTKSLFAQSAVQVLERDFAGSEVSFLLFDAQTGVLLSSHWENPEKRIPMGSLVKPFTALAYAEGHDFHYPAYTCRGAASGCWQQRPHGKLNIVSAMALSCNSYFREMAANLTGDRMFSMAEKFGLDAPDTNLAGPPLMGLGEEWPISPLHIAHAYLELYRRRDQPGVREILAGMGQSAKQGTGSGVGRALKHAGALAKTGTAPCTHQPAAPGDGFAVALVPADRPELLLLVRVHGVPGSIASITAGRMLSRLEE